MQLRIAFLIWITLIFGFFFVFWLCMKFQLTQWFTAGYYIFAGIFLNRKVLRNLVTWHDYHNTIDNVSSAKLGYALVWPLRYFTLFVRLGIMRVL